MARTRSGLAASLLRLRSDEQLVSLFRAGNEDAFRVIHDRYRARIHAYARQMLSSAAADAEDVVQEIFVRAYLGLRSNRRELALRAWLYRIAHNRCIDELRRPQAIAVEAVEELAESRHADPHARVEQREALQRLIEDVRRLPDQQRSALLMRELGGMPYADLSGALGVSVPAVKSLLVRARVGLVQASEARDTACAAIREDLIVAHDRGVRASGRARRHMRDCSHCRKFRTEVHGVSRRLGLLLPILGPVGAAAKLLGIGTLGGGGAAAGSSTGAAAGSTAAAAGSTAAVASSTGAAAGGSLVAGGGAVAVGGTAAVSSVAAGTGAMAVGTGAMAVGTGAVAVGTGAVAAGGGALAAAGTGHVAAIIAASVVAAGSAIGIQQASTGHGPDVAAAAHAPAAEARAAALVTSAPAAVPQLSGTTRDPVATVPSSTVGGTPSPAGRSASRGSGATVASAGGGYLAGSGLTSTATSTGGGTTTSATTSTGPATVPAGTPTAGSPTASPPTATTSGTPGSAGPTSTVPTTTSSGTGASPPGTGIPGSATATTPSGAGTTASGSPTTTVPASGAPTSTSAATTTARGGHASGGSTIIPVLGAGRTERLSARARHLVARGSRGGLFSVRITSR
ncbi:MAG TPA: sigma-70 family RNA polymerase sigma factor [Solirubrobacteraceae bacterium]|nr:sigma-70 family RNA polymerase sigma factor [Solirubrobacteraceae bacterium]